MGAQNQGHGTWWDTSGESRCFSIEKLGEVSAPYKPDMRVI